MFHTGNFPEIAGIICDYQNNRYICPKRLRMTRIARDDAASSLDESGLDGPQ